MANNNHSDIIDQLVGSFLAQPVKVSWADASGIPFPDRYSEARLAMSGIATAWLNLEEIVWRAAQVTFIPGFPARIELHEPSIDIVIGQKALDTWLSQFNLPYQLVLADDGLVVHTRIAGFPLAEFKTRLEVTGGWFVLEPQRASIFGVPSYVSSLFRSYLPLPPLADQTRLAAIEHEAGSLRLRFALDDFEEEVTPGILSRLHKRFFPMTEQIGGFLNPGAKA